MELILKDRRNSGFLNDGESLKKKKKLEIHETVPKACCFWAKSTTYYTRP